MSTEKNVKINNDQNVGLDQGIWIGLSDPYLSIFNLHNNGFAVKASKQNGELENGVVCMFHSFFFSQFFQMMDQA